MSDPGNAEAAERLLKVYRGVFNKTIAWVELPSLKEGLWRLVEKAEEEYRMTMESKSHE